MSKLVNYKKRSVTLPPGCKNLIDVLQLRTSRKAFKNLDLAPDSGPVAPEALPTVTRDESVAGKLLDLENHVAMLFESRSRTAILTVTPPDNRFTLDVDRFPENPVEASVAVQMGTDQERAVRRAFERHGLDLPEDSGIPPYFVPDVPVHITFEISPLPGEVPLVSKLMADLLRDSFMMTNESSLSFRHYEFTSSGE